MKNLTLALVSLFTFSVFAMDTVTEPTDKTTTDAAATTLDESEFRNEIMEMMEAEGMNTGDETTTPVAVKQKPGKREAKARGEDKKTTPDTSVKQ